MFKQATSTTILLALSFLFVLPTQLPATSPSSPTVSAPQPLTVQSGVTTWSPFGPYSDSVLFAIFPDATSEYSELVTPTLTIGGVDIADAPAPGGFDCTNVDFYCTTPDGLGNTYVALNAWNFQPSMEASLVAASPGGFSTGNAYFSFLNMHENPDLTPANPAYTAGGGIPRFIRRGLSTPTTTLNPLFATSPVNSEVASLVYDSLLKQNPDDSSQLVDWQAKRHSQSIVAGNTVQTWELRNDLKWSDSMNVLAEDVCFSIQTYRDIVAAFPPGTSCVMIGMRTVQVTLPGTSTDYEKNVGKMLLLPKHVWDEDNNGIVDPLKAVPTFDPQAAGKMIGDGPFVCNMIFTGLPGGPCVLKPGGTPGGQATSPGDKIYLERYLQYMRCCPTVQETSLQKLSWADKNDDGRISILDIADAALYFGSDHGYWDNRFLGVFDGQVDIGEIATIAFYFDHRLTPSPATGIDPKLDPYLADIERGSYYQGYCQASNNWQNQQLGCLYYVGVFSTTGSASVATWQILPPIPPGPSPPPAAPCQPQNLRTLVYEEGSDGKPVKRSDTPAVAGEEPLIGPGHVVQSDCINKIDNSELPAGHYIIIEYVDKNNNGTYDGGDRQIRNYEYLKGQESWQPGPHTQH